ncbi:MAG: hypothetical protein ABSF34_12000, partial [Verrucomicrobiota bacterium]
MADINRSHFNYDGFSRIMILTPNKSRGCVKTHGDKFGNDPFCDMGNFDEMSRRIRWSKNEFSHSLSPEPTAVGAAVAIHAVSRRWLFHIRFSGGRDGNVSPLSDS